jgi:alpha-mannosidase
MAKKHVHLVGNAHIDPVWFWRWPEGYAEIKASFRSALDRMEEYPDFVFTCACADYYRWVEENAPEMFEEIRARVAEGRWRVVGGMWIQPDCNVPSGESFARHFLYSQGFFLSRFGIKAETGYNVDSFGHAGTLPKLLRGGGMQNYVMMRPGVHENPDIPGYAFWWEANDGSRVLTFRIPDAYCDQRRRPVGNFDDEVEIKRLRANMARFQAAGLPAMHFYGVGNHGGGPTIHTIELFRKLMDMPEGEPLCWSDPDSCFAELRQETMVPVWKNELQHHASGCYSTCSEIKRNNRRAENRLTSAEKLAVLSGSLVGYALPQERIDKAWQQVLFNQFHDIMGGCASKDTYDDAREAHGLALSTAAEITNAAAQRISWAVNTMTSPAGPDMPRRSKESDWSLWEYQRLGTPIVVYNPLPWARPIPVQPGRPLTSVLDETGQSTPVQQVRAGRTNGEDKWDSLFVAQVPAMGYRVYWVFLDSEKPTNPAGSLKTSDCSLENDHLRLELNPTTGHITRLYDKAQGWEAFSAPAAPVVVDIEHSDTWGHMLFEFRKECGRFENARVRLLEDGPVRARLRVESRYGASTLIQDYILYRDAREVLVEARLDWHEHYKMLKLSFPVDAENDSACYDAPFGYQRKAVTGTEESGQQWFDVTGERGGKTRGLAVLNDGKYSFDVLGSEMRMTVANGSEYADHYAGEHRDDQAEYLDQGRQDFRYILMPHAGAWQKAGVVKRAIELNTERIQINETYHEGPLPQAYAGIEVPDENLIVTAVKPAADGNGTILRVYESAGRDTESTITLTFLGRSLEVALGSNEVKTYRLPKEAGAAASECNLYETADL